ncbi:MAG: hypothetical protein HOO96_41505 [Polyangiaceae bacterium]|nr:hypothetical protein [Polyangiaceae bacterium]
MHQAALSLSRPTAVRLRNIVALACVAVGLAATSACSSGSNHGSSSSGGSSGTANGVNCSVTTDGCRCNPYGSPNSFVCDDSAADSLCCADSGWPSSGSCSCLKREVKCAISGSSCNCSASQFASGSTSTTCYGGGTTTSTASPLKCCLDASAGTCTCPNYKATCAGTEVTSCSASSLEPKCSSGTQVTACSTGSTGGSSSGGSSGSSSGSSGGAKCSPKSGDCSGSGDCACGQSCFASAVCTNCTKRCGYSCVTDQDCVALQALHNLSTSYTKCVKTSPNFEIYRCQ